MTTAKALTVAQPTEVTFQQIERMAQAAAKSGLFGVKDVDQAMALMMIAQAEGMHPALAARDYHIINGKPALKSDTMLARFQQAGGRVDWKEYTDAKVVGVFSHPQAGSVTVDWTIERAITAGLMRNPTWKNYPRAMLRARVISEGVRTCYPGVAVGTYTVEEMQDIEPTNVTPQTHAQKVDEVVQTAANIGSALTAAELDEYRAHIQSASSQEDLSRVFAAAWVHAKQARDKFAADDLKQAYDARKQELTPIASEVQS